MRDGGGARLLAEVLMAANKAAMAVGRVVGRAVGRSRRMTKGKSENSDANVAE